MCHNSRRDWREDVRAHRREVALAMIAEALEAWEAARQVDTKHMEAEEDGNTDG